MIKIEITDPHLLDDTILTKTAEYLLSFTKEEIKIIGVDKGCGDKTVLWDHLKNKIDRKEIYLENSKTVETDEKYQNKSVDPIKDFKPVGTPGTYETPEGTKKYNKNGDEIDNNGIPWDSRIHAKSKTKNADGNWKLARGVEIAEVDRVVNELLQKPTVVPPVPTAPIINSEIPKSMMDKFEQQNFDYFVSRLTEYLREGKTTRMEVNNACETVGLENFTELQHVPELIPQVLKKLEEIINSKE